MRKILIAGPSGAGKTELAMMLASKQEGYGYQSTGDQPVSMKQIRTFGSYVFDNCSEGSDKPVQKIFETPAVNDNCTVIAVYRDLPIWAEDIDDTYTYQLK
jgi:GTPase SAR1 family protein